MSKFHKMGNIDEDIDYSSEPEEYRKDERKIHLIISTP